MCESLPETGAVWLKAVKPLEYNQSGDEVRSVEEEGQDAGK